METYVELIQRVLEIQSGGRPRRPELVAEDDRLMDGLQKRNLAGRIRTNAYVMNGLYGTGNGHGQGHVNGHNRQAPSSKLW
jgi:hypothetical protein